MTLVVTLSFSRKKYSYPIYIFLDCMRNINEWCNLHVYLTKIACFMLSPSSSSTFSLVARWKHVTYWLENQPQAQSLGCIISMMINLFPNKLLQEINEWIQSNLTKQQRILFFFFKKKKGKKLQPARDMDTLLQPNPGPAPDLSPDPNPIVSVARSVLSWWWDGPEMGPTRLSREPAFMALQAKPFYQRIGLK